MKENWLKIKSYKGYEVSDLGRVRSLKNGKVRVLKPQDNGIGYLQVVLCKNGKRKSFYIHRLVYETFIGPIPKGMVVNHLNEDKRDNRLVNLEVTTQKQNCNYGTRNERAGKSLSKELKLTHAKSCAKYTFSSSVEASSFFGYRTRTQIGVYIFKARQRGENFIKIRREKYYFLQAS